MGYPGSPKLGFPGSPHRMPFHGRPSSPWLYYDFMDRFWMGARDVYSRSSLLPAGKNGKTPKKVIGPDGKQVEPEAPSSITTKDIVRDIMDGRPASANPEAALPRIFFLIAVLPSIRLGLIDPASFTLSGDGTAVISQPPLTAGIFPPAHLSAPTGAAADAIIPIPTQSGDRTVTTKTGILAIPFICSAPGTMRLRLNSPSS